MSGASTTASAVFAILTSLLAQYPTAHAEEVSTLFGAEISCGDWNEARRGSGIAETTYKGYIAGFVSGMSIGLERDLLKGQNVNSAYSFVDKHCRERPLNSLFLAAMALTTEYAKVHRQNRP